MKIYLSYSHHDKELVYKIKDYLLKQEFEVIYDEDLLTIGDNFNEKIRKALFESDIYLPIISENFQVSYFTNSELQTAIGYSTINKYPIIFPYILEGTAIPEDIKDRLCIIGTSDIKRDLEKITIELNKIQGALFAENNNYSERTTIIEQNLTVFLNDVFTKLEKNEKRNRVLSYICYILSISFLIAIIPFVYNITLYNSYEQDLVNSIMYGVKNIAGLSVFAALSRLSFILGKSFMVESIRNGDRIHAISFGRFYIKAYGHEATRQEIREVLGDWNIDKGSSFHSQDAKEIDPNFSGTLEVLKSYLNEK